MTKLSIAALVAVGVFAIYSAPSFAAVARPTPPKKPDPTCQVNCGGESTEPGDPFIPGLPDGGEGVSPADVAELRACLARLDGLPQVDATQINQFGQPYKVTVNPICDEKSLTDVQPVLVEGGNVAGLEQAIRRNDLMTTKLGQSAYKARDVVGIDFDSKGNAILFVHKRG